MKPFPPLALLLALLLGASASADEVHLKSGGILKGEIREDTPKGIVLASAYGVLKLDRDQVESVTRSTYTPPPPVAAPEKAAPPSPEAQESLPDRLAHALPAFSSFDYTEEAAAAAKGLVEGGRAMVPLIADALPEATPTQQKWLADVLGEIKDPAGGKAVLDLVHSPKWEVKVSAAQVLTLLKHPQAPQILTNLLHDDDWNVRLAAARGLGVLRTRDSVPALIEHLSDSNLLVRGAAHDSLTTITDEALPARPEDWKTWLQAHPIGKERVDINGRPIPKAASSEP